LASRTTTFDKYTTAQTRNDVVITSIQNDVNYSTTITVPSGVSTGYGWTVTSQDVNSDIGNGVYIVSINGASLTLSSPIFATAGAVIHIDGGSQADYSTTESFDSINAQSLAYVREAKLIDGVSNFLQYEIIIFVDQQQYVGQPNNGWTKNGLPVPGYLDKLSGISPINQQGGAWRINWVEMPTLGFDDDAVGFDSPSVGLVNAYFEQGGDSEISLEFIKEVLLNQYVTVRSGRTNPNSILSYRTLSGQSVPDYSPVTSAIRTAETTFDGGSCVCRETDIMAGRQGIAGGTRFGSNIDKYIVPESQDKYIKFPQTGVFV
jgi:hypothetical protein